MQNALPVILLIAVAAAAAGLLVYAGWRAREKRREELSALAARLGLSFDPEPDASHDDRFGQFACFARGHSRAAYNTMEGTLAVGSDRFPVRMGDYTYKVTRSNGKSTTTTTYRLSYALIRPSWGTPPDLLIRREGLWDKIAGAMGFDDIDFESEAFSRAFHVKSSDKKFAYDVVHPRMMEFLMSGQAPALELKGGYVCIAGNNRCWTAEEFPARLEWVRAFFGLWPEHLTRELAGRAGGR